MLDKEIYELKKDYKEADERYFENEHSTDLEFWSDLYYEVDGVANIAIDIINQLKEELRKQVISNSDLAVRNLTLKEENDQLKAELASVNHSLRFKCDEVNTLQKENELLRDELDKSDEAINKLQEELIESEDAYNELYDHIEEMEADLESTRKELESFFEDEAW